MTRQTRLLNEEKLVHVPSSLMLKCLLVLFCHCENANWRHVTVNTTKNASDLRPLRFALWKRPLTGLLQHSNLICWGRIYLYSCLSTLKNVIASSHCVEGWSHVCACDRVPVHSVFKADPIKQTEPGHGRIAWKRVGEGWRGMEPGAMRGGIQWETEHSQKVRGK